MILLLLLLTIAGLGISNEDLGELVFVNVLYRHGARTPIHPYKTDPFGNIKFWNNKNWGQLTDEGKCQQYEHGEWLRNRYDGFLPLEYSDDDIYVFSTDVDYTLMSAYANLAGLYPPGKNGWNPDLNWQPIPVHTIPQNLDKVVLASKSCPRKELLNKDEVQNDKFKDTFDYASKHSGENITDIESCMMSIYETLHVEFLAGFQLPEWTHAIYPQPLTEIAEMFFKSLSGTPELCRLQSGNLIQELITHFEKKLNGTISQVMWMYSAHDLVLAALMDALGIYNGRNPPYCATLMMELRKRENENFVVFQYMNSSSVKEDSLTYLLEIPNCGVMCPLKQFIKQVEKLIPVDWEEECKLSSCPAP